MLFRHRFSLFLFSLFPQILLVALCNSRAMGEAGENSDIDLFIIAKRGNLWTVRFIVTALTSMFGIRRRNTHGLQKGTPEYIERTKDRFCLSFFITEEAMNLENIRLQPDDPYLDKWTATLVPLVNKRGTFERFMEANGSVIPAKSDKGGREVESMHLKNPPYPLNLNFNLRYSEGICHSSPLSRGHTTPSFFEGFIRRMWLPKTLQTYEKLGKPWGVVISDTMLKFHDQDVRKEYQG